jgi:uncharacterized protein
MPIASYRSPKTIVRPSGIVGRGLFANELIHQGEIVCIKSGHLLDREELIKHKDVVKDSELQIADNLFLAPITKEEFEGVMMFLNHSCDPNVGIQGQIAFVAMRDIAIGEELTLDYATIDQDCESMICQCGAKNCRRLITSDDWKRPDLQQKYGDYFAWYLLQKIRG